MVSLSCLVATITKPSNNHFICALLILLRLEVCIKITSIYNVLMTLLFLKPETGVKFNPIWVLQV